jgi:hypothetical protein
VRRRGSFRDENGEVLKKTTPQRRLSPTQLAEMMALADKADSVELKLTVPAAHRRATVQALALDPLDGQVRQVVFFDTPDLQLDQAGVVVRARRVQGVGDDSVVKLRPVVPGDLPKRLRRAAEFGVEVDAMPGGFVCSGSYKGKPHKVAVLDVLREGSPIRKLFSKEQRSFYDDHAPAGITLDDLVALGPINVLKVKFAPPELRRKMVAELWLYPDGSQILELSTKCAPADALRVSDEAREYLGERGVDLGGEQQTKTRTALRFYSKELSSTGS